MTKEEIIQKNRDSMQNACNQLREFSGVTATQFHEAVMAMNKLSGIKEQPNKSKFHK